MANLLNETRFEEHITKMLANSVLYNERKSANFDIETLCDKEMLERFLKAQTLTWKKLYWLSIKQSYLLFMKTSSIEFSPSPYTSGSSSPKALLIAMRVVALTPPEKVM